MECSFFSPKLIDTLTGPGISMEIYLFYKVHYILVFQKQSSKRYYIILSSYVYDNNLNSNFQNSFCF